MRLRSLSPLQKAILLFAGGLAFTYALAAIFGEGYGPLPLALVLAAYPAAVMYSTGGDRSAPPVGFLRSIHPEAGALIAAALSAAWMLGWVLWFPTFRESPGNWFAFVGFMGVLNFLTLRDRRWRARGLSDYPAKWLTDDKWVLVGAAAFVLYAVARLARRDPDYLTVVAIAGLSAIMVAAAVFLARELRREREKWQPRSG